MKSKLEELLSDKSLSPAETIICVSLLMKTIDEASDTIFIEPTKLSESCAITRQSVYNSLKNLELMQYITKIEKENNLYKINFTIFEKIKPDFEFESINMRSLSVSNYLTNEPNDLTHVKKNSKSILQKPILPMIERVFLSVKNIDTTSKVSKNNLRQNIAKCHFILQGYSDIKLLDIKTLVKSNEVLLNEFHDILNKFSLYILYKDIVLLYCIDLLLFNGKLILGIVNYFRKSSGKRKVTDSVEAYELNTEDIPSILLTSSFIEQYKRWLEYKREEKKEPVTKNVALSELKFLSQKDNPEDVIDFSIRVSAKSLVEKTKYEQKEDVYSSNSKRKVY